MCMNLQETVAQSSEPCFPKLSFFEEFFINLFLDFYTVSAGITIQETFAQSSEPLFWS